MKKITKAYFHAIVAIPIGIAVTGVLSLVIHNNARDHAVARFENTALSHHKAIENEVNDTENALRSVNGLFITAWPVSRTQFRMFTSSLLQRYPYIHNITYNVNLTKEERQSFEEQNRQLIPEFTIMDREASGKLRESALRQEYVVTTYIEPMFSNKSLLGLDNWSIPLYGDTIKKARDSGTISTTPDFTLDSQVKDSDNHKKAVMLWMPLYQGGMSPATAEERANNLIGFTTLTLKISDFIADSLKDVGADVNKSIDVQLIDVTQGKEPHLLHSTINQKASSWFSSNVPTYEKPINIGSHVWKVKLSPKEGHFYIDHTSTYVTLIGGIFISFLLGFFLYSRQKLQEQKQKEEQVRLKNAEQQAVVEQLHIESERLNNIIETQGEIVRAEFDLDEFLHVAAERLLRLTHAQGAMIEMLEGHETHVVAVVGTAQHYKGTRISIDNSLSGTCLKTKTSQLCSDAFNDSRVDYKLTVAMNVRSILVVPLLHSDGAVGVLKIISSDAHAFQDRDMQTLKVLGHVVGTALQQRLSAETKSKLLEDLQNTADELFREKELAQVTLRAIGDAVITTDIYANITYLNPVAENLTGWSNHEAMGHSIIEVFNIINEETRKVANNPVLKALSANCIVGMDPGTLLVHKDGKECAVDDSAAPIFDREGKPIGAVLVFRDVSQERKLANEIAYQARHDALTGLFNRREFNKKIDVALQEHHRNGKVSTLLYLDLDQFKIVNDTCGHAAGDELLLQVTSLLKSNVRTEDIVARLGGDEFGILLNGCVFDASYRVAENLREKIEHFRFHWDGQVFGIGVSIGLVNFAVDTFDLKRILSAADSACYIAKEKGRNQVCIYQPDALEQTERSAQMGWVMRLQKALEENRFALFAQPIVEVQTKEVIHYEMLLRLYEDGKVVPPMAFIPAAERYNMMSTIDKWVVREAFRFASKHSTVMCGINLSGQSIGDEKFLSFVHEEIKHQPIDCSRICFEITETAAIANFAQATKFIQELSKVGCNFALDDFGSGMSSFNYLKELPVDFLKIDGRFVKNMSNDKIDQAMVESINNIGHIMGLKTIAEFVEDEETLKKLHAMGVDYAQGYGIGKPVHTNTVETAVASSLS